MRAQVCVSQPPYIPWFGSWQLSSMFRFRSFSTDTGLLSYKNGSRYPVDMVDNVEKSDIRVYNYVRKQKMGQMDAPCEMKYRNNCVGKFFFSRNLGNLIPIVVAEEHFPVALSVLEIMTIPRIP